MEMTSKDAQDIVDLYDEGKKIDAIKLLRHFSHLGLKDSKEYLERYYHHGKLFLYQQICSEFIMSTEELLANAIRDRDSLNARIIELQSTLNHPAAAVTIDNIFGKPKG